MAEYREHPSPCQTASPQSSSQSLNTTTKSSNVSSIHTIDNYKQIQISRENYEKKLIDERLQQINNFGAYQSLLYPNNNNNSNIYTTNTNLDFKNCENNFVNLNDRKDYESYIRNGEENFSDVNGFKKYYV